jgi:hypothetical protein
MTYLYRGVSARHPAWFAAWMGMVVPGDPNGMISAAEHNGGGVEEWSPFTSWTYRLATAEFHRDKDGPGGLLLRVQATPPGPKEKWSWEWSPDIYFEQETLLKGIRIGVEVIV